MFHVRRNLDCSSNVCRFVYDFIFPKDVFGGPNHFNFGLYMIYIHNASLISSYPT